MKKIILLSALISFTFSCKTDNTKNNNSSSEKNTVILDSISINLPAGFELEELYSPSDHEQGSWVALAQGPNQNMFACDQYGKIYSFKTPSEEDVLNKTTQFRYR